MGFFLPLHPALKLECGTFKRDYLKCSSQARPASLIQSIFLQQVTSCSPHHEMGFCDCLTAPRDRRCGATLMARSNAIPLLFPAMARKSLRLGKQIQLESGPALRAT